MAKSYYGPLQRLNGVELMMTDTDSFVLRLSSPNLNGEFDKIFDIMVRSIPRVLFPRIIAITPRIILDTTLAK